LALGGGDNCTNRSPLRFFLALSGASIQAPYAPFYLSGVLFMTTVFTPAPNGARRRFLQSAAAASAVATVPGLSMAQTADAERQFAPQAGTWRTFDVTTRIDITAAQGATRVWLPIPSVNSGWQQSLDSSFTSNGSTCIVADGRYGAHILYAEFAADVTKPFVELTSRIQTQNRSQDWSKKNVSAESAQSLAQWTQGTHLIPVDGIVREIRWCAARMESATAAAGRPDA
jgi:hypothetical protein